jgi:hypothetical protein
MFERAVPDECFISIHSEQPILSFGEVLYMPLLDVFERQNALP